MPDKEQKGTEANYIKQYVGENGYVYDATNIRKRLANEAYDRYTEQEEDQDLIKYAEEQYIKAVYPKEKDEYLVEGAILTCTMATTDKKIYRDKKYMAASSGKVTALSVTENKEFQCCDLCHATVKDAKKEDNIPPFRCNCITAPYNDKEWEALESDELCLTQGTCIALMNLNDEWDNLPRTEGDECQEINGIPSINMGSILFCRHGGIISAVSSGQEELYALACTISGDHKGELSEEQQKENAQYIYNFFKKQGWTTEAICGMLGNMQKESGMNPGAWQSWEDEGLGFGLVQWTKKAQFFDFMRIDAAEASELAESNPHKMMDIQLDFLVKSFGDLEGNREENVEKVVQGWYKGSAESYYEILPISDGVPRQMTVKEFSKAEYNCKDLALVFHASYERSGDGKDDLQERADAAEKWYRYFTEGAWEES